MICKLCKIKEANQTGSHITSAFLLTTQIGKRGKEKAHLITSNPNQDYSQNEGDTGIKEDNLFCRDCEKRFGIVESIFSTEIAQKIEQPQYEDNFNKTVFENGFYKLECQRIHPIVFQLLMQANIWRASISDLELDASFELTEELQERIRFNLDLFLPIVIEHKIAQSDKEWIKMINNCNNLFDVMPMAIIKSENIENKEMTYEYFDEADTTPYQVIINEYFILLFDSQLTWEDNFLELKGDFDLEQIVNDSNDKAIIAVITNERYFKTIDKIRALAVKQRLDQIRKQSKEELRQQNTPVTDENINRLTLKKVNEIKMGK